MGDFFRALVYSGGVSEFGQVDTVIVDNFLGGPVSVLHGSGIPYWLFDPARAFLQLVLVTMDIECVEDPDRERVSPCFIRQTLGGKYTDTDLEALKDILLENCETVHWAEGIIFNSMRGIDDEDIRYIKSFHGEPKRTTSKMKKNPFHFQKKNPFFLIFLVHSIIPSFHHSILPSFHDSIIDFLYFQFLRKKCLLCLVDSSTSFS